MPERSRTGPPIPRLAALADPVRLSMVRQLSQACDVCACVFDVEGHLAQPTASHHRRVLREAGCARAERRGAYIHSRSIQGTSGG